MDVLYFIQSFTSSVLPIAVSAGTAIYAYFANKSRAAAKEIDDLRAQNDTLTKRVDKLENEMKHLPDKDMVNELRLALVKMEGTIGRLEEKVGGVAHTVSVIDEAIRKEMVR